MNNEPDYKDNLYFEKAKEMTDLTEKWKKGELPNGLYYVENIYGTITTSEYFGESKFFVIGDDNVKKVLAPVPSYSEHIKLDKDNQRLKHEVGNLGYKIKNQRKEIEKQIEQNTQLKDLLKECKQWFDWYHIDTETGKEYIESWLKKGHEIHKKINEVLK